MFGSGYCLPLPGLTGLPEGLAFLAGRLLFGLAFLGFAEVTFSGLACLLFAAGTTFTAGAGFSSALTVSCLFFSGSALSGFVCAKTCSPPKSERTASKSEYLFIEKIVHNLNTI